MRLQKVSISDNSDAPRIARICKLNKGVLRDKEFLKIRKDVPPVRTLGFSVYDLLREKEIIAPDNSRLNLIRLNELLTEEDVEELKNEELIRIAEKFTLDNLKSAIVSRLIEDTEDSFISKYGIFHDVAVNAIQSLMKNEFYKWSVTKEYFDTLLFAKETEEWLDLSGAYFLDRNLEGLNLRLINFMRAIFIQTELDEANLFRTSFGASNIKRSYFKKADLKHANFNMALISGNDFTEADMESISLVSAYFEYSSFVRANLREADLSWTDIGKEVNFVGADLAGAKIDARWRNLVENSEVKNKNKIIWIESDA